MIHGAPVDGVYFGGRGAAAAPGRRRQYAPSEDRLRYRLSLIFLSGGEWSQVKTRLWRPLAKALEGVV